MENNNNPYYKHYLSIDWSQQDVSIARMRAGSNQPETKYIATPNNERGS